MIDFIIFIAVVSIPIIEFWGLRKFIDSYMEEKGRNLATKEDIQKLTSLTEEIKMLYQVEQYKNENIYDIKLEVIQESLEFLDDYISWLDDDTDVISVRKNIDSDNLTFKARSCYNKLVLTCEEKELPMIFLKLIIGNTENTMLLYNTYRNLCRKEMGLNTELELDKKAVFIKKVSTRALELKIGSDFLSENMFSELQK